MWQLLFPEKQLCQRQGNLRTKNVWPEMLCGGPWVDKVQVVALMAPGCEQGQCEVAAGHLNLVQEQL